MVVKEPQTGKLKSQKLKRKKKPNVFSKTMDRLESEVKDAPAWNWAQFTRKVNVDSLLNLLHIEAPNKIDSLQKHIEQVSNYWDNTLTKTDWEQKYKKTEEKLKTIKPSEINTLTELQSTLTTISQVKSSVDSFKTFMTKNVDSLKTDLSFMQSGIKQVDDWIVQDYKNALKMAKLPDINRQNIGKFIFGTRVVNQLNQVLNIVGQVRYYSAKFKSDKPKKEKPPRFKGQDISFLRKKPMPKFWIKKVHFNGQTKGKTQFIGDLQNWVSNQSLIGKTTTFSIGGARADSANIKLTGLFDYLTETPGEDFSLSLKRIPLSNVKLSASKLLPGKVAKGFGDIQTTLKLSGGDIKNSVVFSSKNVAFQYDQQPSNMLERNIHKLLTNTSKVDFSADISQIKDHFSFRLNSNLDNLFMEQIQSQASAEINKAKQRLQDNVDKKVAPYKEKFEKAVTSNRAKLDEQLQKYQDLLDRNLKLVEEKKQELENRIDAEKKKQSGKLEDKLKKSLNKVL